jgi:signal transduction histidine kinase
MSALHYLVCVYPAGISEGMLSGCCGTLPRSVRRQVYIIRTSGARLLALINDVMDAAALRQQRLILKQERVPLKPLVDDMLDLTHSLVRERWEGRN